jgi:hypothetical protein
MVVETGRNSLSDLESRSHELLIQINMLIKVKDNNVWPRGDQARPQSRSDRQRYGLARYRTRN